MSQQRASASAARASRESVASISIAVTLPVDRDRHRRLPSRKRSARALHDARRIAFWRLTPFFLKRDRGFEQQRVDSEPCSSCAASPPGSLPRPPPRRCPTAQRRPAARTRRERPAAGRPDWRFPGSNSASRHRCGVWFPGARREPRRRSADGRCRPTRSSSSCQTTWWLIDQSSRVE